MKKATVPLFVALLLALGVPRAHADNMDLFDFALSTSSGISGDYGDIATLDPTMIIDPTSSIYNDTSCCGDASGGTTPGLGALSYTFNPGAPGAYTVSLYFDYDVLTPDFNEYGTINNAGSAQAGITGEIFNATSPTSNIKLYGECGTANCETYGLASGLNNVQGTTDNFLDGCVGVDCNADVGMALTYSFTLPAGQEAVISADLLTTVPGGFSLETTHPVDTNNAAAASVYLTGSYIIQPATTSTVPEPSAWVLLVTVLAFVGFQAVRRKNVRA